MKSEKVFLLIFFFAAVLSLQVHSAPSASAYQKQKTPAHETEDHDRVLSECEYHFLDKRTLIDDILTACRGIVRVSSNIHHKLLGPNSLWATVGVYNNAGVNSIAPSGHMQLSAVHYSVAASVSIFQSFLRPLGVALTEETLREVAQMEPDTVRQELYDIYGSLATVSTRTFQLIENDINIHVCIVPHLPANTSVTLRPSHLQQDTFPRHKLVVDGLANELRSLAANVILLLNCMNQNIGSCDFGPK